MAIRNTLIKLITGVHFTDHFYSFPCWITSESVVINVLISLTYFYILKFTLELDLLIRSLLYFLMIINYN